MSYNAAWTGIVEILAEVTGVPAEEMTPEQDFENDFGFDSLTVVEIAVMVEQRLGVTVPDEMLAHLTTIGDVAEYVAGREQVGA